MAATVAFENDRVRVLRVRHAAGERHPQRARHDRLIIYLNPGHVRRVGEGTKEEIHRAAGEVVWRDRSQHAIENLSDQEHEVIIVELK